MSYKPVDITFRNRKITFANLINGLLLGSYKFEEEGPVDESILEFALLHGVFDNLIVRFYRELDMKDSIGHIILGFEFFRGHGLLRTLKYFIVEDHPFNNLKVFTEYNGKRPSELGRAFNRHIEEVYVDMVIDDSFHNGSNEVSIDYVKMLNSAL